MKPNLEVIKLKWLIVMAILIWISIYSYYSSQYTSFSPDLIFERALTAKLSNPSHLNFLDVVNKIDRSQVKLTAMNDITPWYKAVIFIKVYEARYSYSADVGFIITVSQFVSADFTVIFTSLLWR